MSERNSAQQNKSEKLKTRIKNGKRNAFQESNDFNEIVTEVAASER